MGQSRFPHQPKLYSILCSSELSNEVIDRMEQNQFLFEVHHN